MQIKNRVGSERLGSIEVEKTSKLLNQETRKTITRNFIPKIEPQVSLETMQVKLIEKPSFNTDNYLEKQINQ